MSIGTGNRVIDLVQLAGLLAKIDFDVGDRGLARRTPVHDRQIAIDQTVLVQLDEDVAHRAGEAFVEREAQPSPVGGGPEAFELFDDLVAVFLLPLPHALDEFLASKADARDALAGQVAFDHQLRGDTRMICPGKPERVEAAHPLPPHDDVLQCIHEGVADMQAASDVRRRNDDGKLRPLAVEVGREEFALLPLRVNPLLEISGVESFCQLFFHG